MLVAKFSHITNMFVSFHQHSLYRGGVYMLVAKFSHITNMFVGFHQHSLYRGGVYMLVAKFSHITKICNFFFLKSFSITCIFFL